MDGTGEPSGVNSGHAETEGDGYNDIIARRPTIVDEFREGQGGSVVVELGQARNALQRDRREVGRDLKGLRRELESRCSPTEQT